MTSTQPQLIRMVDQHGQVVPLIIQQDGHPPGLVLPGKRTRFKILASPLAYKINLIVLPECSEDWHVNDINIGGQTVFGGLRDSPEEDGLPGYFFNPPVDEYECFLPFTTCQIGMAFVLDVTYHGPIREGAPFCCHLRCTATYAAEDAESREPQLVGKWRAPDWKQCDFAISMMEGGYGYCSRELGHADPHRLHPLPPEKIGGTGKRAPVEGARWMKECSLDIGWVTFERQAIIEPHRVGAQEGFIILEDAEGKQTRFREWEFIDIIDGVERLGQLPRPRFSHDGARKRLQTLRPELDEDAIKAVIFAVRAGGACDRSQIERDMSMSLKVRSLNE